MELASFADVRRDGFGDESGERSEGSFAAEEQRVRWRRHAMHVTCSTSGLGSFQIETVYINKSSLFIYFILFGLNVIF